MLSKSTQRFQRRNKRTERRRDRHFEELCPDSPQEYDVDSIHCNSLPGCEYKEESSLPDTPSLVSSDALRPHKRKTTLLRCVPQLETNLLGLTEATITVYQGKVHNLNYSPNISLMN